jgi:hypothetical protein
VKHFQYADDTALAFKVDSFSECEANLETDRERLGLYFRPTKTVYSTAEYCAPVWLNSVHVSKIDVQLNNTIRLISGTIKLTQLQWLQLRREEATMRKLVNSRRHARSLLYGQMSDISVHVGLYGG